MNPPVSGRSKKSLWILTGVTYGLVIVTTVVAALLYYSYFRGAPGSADGQPSTMAVGSIWLPVYPGASFRDMTSSTQGNSTQHTVSLKSKDPADKLIAFYGAKLKRGTFLFDTVTKNANGGTVRAVARGGKATVLVTITSSGGGAEGTILTVEEADRK